jgi:hypothetical protein
MKRHVISLAVSAALTLATLPAMAADSHSDLAPGPAAGIQSAQSFAMGTVGYVAVGIAAIAIIAVVASSNGGGGGNTSTTTTGGP